MKEKVAGSYINVYLLDSHVYQNIHTIHRLVDWEVGLKAVGQVYNRGLHQQPTPSSTSSVIIIVMVIMIIIIVIHAKPAQSKLARGLTPLAIPQNQRQ